LIDSKKNSEFDTLFEIGKNTSEINGLTMVEAKLLVPVYFF